MKDTSLEAYDAIASADDFVIKNALIILALWDAPNSLPWDISKATGYRHDYVKPRCTVLKDYGVVEETTRGLNPDTRRAAYRLALRHDVHALINECIEADADPLDVARHIFLEFRAAYEAALQCKAEALARAIA